MSQKFSRQSHQADKRPRRHFPIITLSDVHLGMDCCSADMLYEFLENASCDILVLNGDIIDGWTLEINRRPDFPEMQKRVMDLINARIAEGMRVVYITGNHDEALRKLNIFGKEHFGIGLANALVYKDPRDRRILFIHGDEIQREVRRERSILMAYASDRLYDAFVRLNRVTAKASSRYLGRRFSLAAALKKGTKNTLGIIREFENAALRFAQKNGLDGINCGHIHYATCETIEGVQYGNSGDWLDSCSALVCDEQGEWGVVRWLEERERLGLAPPPDESDPNPYAAFRDVTERQLRLIRRLWPVKIGMKLSRAIGSAKDRIKSNAGQALLAVGFLRTLEL